MHSPGRAVSPMLAIVAITLFASLGFEVLSRLGRPQVPSIDGGLVVALVGLAALAAASMVVLRSRDRPRLY